MDFPRDKSQKWDIALASQACVYPRDLDLEIKTGWISGKQNTKYCLAVGAVSQSRHDVHVDESLQKTQ